jgi:hypothetical protein
MDKTTHRTHDWQSFIDLAEKPSTTIPGGVLRRHLDTREGRQEWAGCSHAEALRRARSEGYAEVLPEVEQLVGAIDQQITTERFQTTFQTTFDVTGSEVDLGRFLSGEPECMVESLPIRIARRGRAVRIVLPVNYSATVEPDQVRRRGAAVMALCDVLARAQHPLEVWAAVCNTAPGGARYACVVKVQDADQPLDAGRLLFALAHPAMLRQLGFAVEEHEKATTRKQFGYVDGGGYGGPSYAVQEGDLPDQYGQTIVLPELQPRDKWELPQAVAWVNQQLECIFGE